MNRLIMVAVVLCIGAGEASAQALNTPGLSPNVSALPSPLNQPGPSSSMPSGNTGFTNGNTAVAPSFGTPLVNPRITNYGAGGMQRPPGSPRGSNR
jgi:hypothetical protein